MLALAVDDGRVRCERQLCVQQAGQDAEDGRPPGPPVLHMWTDTDGGHAGDPVRPPLLQGVHRDTDE